VCNLALFEISVSRFVSGFLSENLGKLLTRDVTVYTSLPYSDDGDDIGLGFPAGVSTCVETERKSCSKMDAYERADGIRNWCALLQFRLRVVVFD
jgi:hypothetical protein